jgi:DNA repair exonuclease SbcCD nuclease subunit
LSKYLLINDVHLTNENSHPASCTASYTDDLFDLLYQINDLASKLQVRGIIQLGDLFHIKAPGRNSHALIQRTIKWAGSAPCPVWVVPGNHDLLNDRLESLDEGQPLGVLYSSGIINQADGYLNDYTATEEINSWGSDKPITVLPNVLSIYGVPWQTYWDAEQSLADQAVKNALKEFVPADTPQLIVTHAPFFPPGVNPAYEHYSTEKFAKYLNPDGKANVQVIYGHIHDWHGEYVVNGVRFANYGALSRGSWTESNITRPIGVTIWDSVTGKFEFVELNAKPASEVFRVKEISAVRTTQLKLDEFLASVGQSHIEVTSIEAVMNKVRELKLGKEFENVVEELLTNV